MDRPLSTFSCALTLLICISAHADKVYRWIDKGGNVHYSSTPPATTVSTAQKVDVGAPQVISVVTPTMPKPLPQAQQRPAANDSIDKAKADAIDKQIRGTWGDFTDGLVCESLEKQIADLRNAPNLTGSERDARIQALEAQKKRDCP